MRFWFWFLLILAAFGLTGGLLGFPRFWMASIIIVALVGAMVLRGVILTIDKRRATVIGGKNFR